jgi:hypothetical protein
MKRGEKQEENTDPVMIISEEVSYHSLLASNAHQEVYRKCSQFAEEVCEDDYVPAPARPSHRMSQEKVSIWTCRMKKLMSNSCPPKKYHGQKLGRKRASSMLSIREGKKSRT